MALIIVESFDGVTQIGQLLGKWTAALAGTNTVAGLHGNEVQVGGLATIVRQALTAAEEDDLLIVGARYRWSNLDSPRRFLEFFSDNSALANPLRFTVTTAGAISVQLGGGATIASTDAGVIQANTRHYIEIKARHSNSTSDLVIRVDGVARTLSPAGPWDTNNGYTKTVWDGFQIISANNVTFSLDDVYALNEKTTDALGNTAVTDFLGDVRVEAINPDGNGNSSQFVGSDGNSTDNYLLVDELAPDDDTTYVESDVDNDKDTYAFSNLASTAGSVAGVQIITRARKTDTGTRLLAHVARSGGTEVDSADFSLAETYGTQRSIREAKPGGGAYSRADVDAAEFGIKARA